MKKRKSGLGRGCIGLAILAAGSIFFLAGCWDSRELNSLAIVSGIAIDSGENEAVRVAIQVIKPTDEKTADSGSKEGNGAFIITAEGPSLAGTIQKADAKISRTMFFSHNNLLVFGQAVAEAGMRKYFDYFLRDNENRRLVWLLIARDRAENILNANMNFGSVSGADIYDLLENQKNYSQSVTVNVQDFLSRLLSETSAPLAPIVEIDQTNNKIVDIVGTAIFDGDRMVGELDIEQTRGCLWVNGTFGQGNMDVLSPDRQGIVSLHVKRAKSEIIPEIVEDTVRMTIRIEAEAYISSDEVSAELLSTIARETLEKNQREVIEKEIRSALKTAQELKTDIFGFGDQLYKYQPQEWKKIKQNWREIFPRIQVALKIENKLRRTGTTVQPPVKLK
ncbi:MAG: Ger(x)C family spore germination protein [Peptococcaceae bacterium]|jgi:spore germination protein KC|nr:Ger(x)C family spore germination protein [Peptococcaceae bacterium]